MTTARRALLPVALSAVLAAAFAGLAPSAALAAGAAATAASPTPTPEPPAPAEPLPREVPVMPTTVVHAGSPSAATTPPAAAPARPAIPPQPAHLAVRTIPLAGHGTIEVGPPRVSRWHGSPISLSLRDAPLEEVLRSFAKLAGVNLVIQPGVHGAVTCELHDVPWDQALYVILKSQGLGAEIDGRIWTVEKP